MDFEGPPTYNEFDELMEVRKLPNVLIANIFSYDITNKYNKYYDKYTWDDIEYMLYELMEFDVNFCEHIFKIFRSIGDRITIFYPNAFNDTEVILKPKKFQRTRVRGICLSRHIWFHHDYYKMSQGGKKYYLDDGQTNYDDMIRMTMNILKKSDEWYWTSYAGEEDILNCIMTIYETLEKHFDMLMRDSYESYENSTIQEASAHYTLDEIGVSRSPNIFYISDEESISDEDY